MATTRRTRASAASPDAVSANGNATSKSTSTASTTKMASSPPYLSNPFLPTPLEMILLSIYPGTLVLGSLFSILNTTNRNAPYSAESQAHVISTAPSYFARKSNVFNQYFVKIGWVWITLAFVSFLFSHSSLGPRLSPTLTPRRAKAALRYTIITAVWCSVTQWFFGPPIIDRGFKITGGQCQVVYADSAEAEIKRQRMGQAREVLTHAACKAVGGQWKGGHDISGHVFILILGSAMLWLEILPAVLVASGLREDRRIRMPDGAVKSAAVETEDGRSDGVEVPRELGVGVKAAVGVAGLSWWMLLMTASYFHTWFEKFTGLVVAFTALYTVYFLPRAIPALRQVVGMPGV